MRQKKEELPVVLEAPGVKMRSLGGQGGMAITHVEISEPADFRPVLEGLPNDKCQVPHWGYVIKGKVTLEYEDGVVESYESGQVYYQPPGHTGQAEAGTETIEFSPDEEFAGLLEHFRSKMGG